MDVCGDKIHGSSDRKSTRLNSSHGYNPYAVFRPNTNTHPYRSSSSSTVSATWPRASSPSRGSMSTSARTISATKTSAATCNRFPYTTLFRSPFCPRQYAHAMRAAMNFVAINPDGCLWRQNSWQLRSEEHTSELQSRLQPVCRLPPEYKHSPVSVEQFVDGIRDLAAGVITKQRIYEYLCTYDIRDEDLRRYL